MNIHFNDEDLFNTLTERSVLSIQVGSIMYGLNTETSDVDWLHIYVEPDYNRRSFLWEHHQLQFKVENVDHNFTTLQNFVRNILTGDSTINFEVLYSKDLIGTQIEFLHNIKHEFINYNIIKSYLGFAKRDLKMLRNMKPSSEYYKKLSHFVRGVISAEMLLSRTYDPTYKYNNILLLSLKQGNFTQSYIDDVISYYENVMNNLRDSLNKELDNKTIPIKPTMRSMVYMDNEIKALIPKEGHINYGTLFFDALGENIKY